MFNLCPECGSAHVTRLDDDRQIDIDMKCCTCGFEYSVPKSPDMEMRSVYDEQYPGPPAEIYEGHPEDLG